MCSNGIDPKDLLKFRDQDIGSILRILRKEQARYEEKLPGLTPGTPDHELTKQMALLCRTKVCQAEEMVRSLNEAFDEYFPEEERGRMP